MVKLKLSIIVFLMMFLTSCASIQSGINVVSDGFIKFSSSIQQAVSRKSCTKSKRGDLSNFTVTPRDVLQGERVTVMACYPVNTTGTGSVREERLITGPDGRTDVLKDEYVDRERGFWESKFDFVIPESLPPGTYTLTQRISYEGLEFEDTHRLVVYRKRA